MLTAIAIDDEPNALIVIENHAGKVSFIELKASFTNAFEAIPYLQSNKPDLIFLDIKMPDITGIEFVSCLQNAPMIIFTTAYSEYALEGFELDAVDYLLKPFSLVRFTKACNKALELKKLRIGTENAYIFLKTGYVDEKVFLDEIQYIEAEGNYLKFVLNNRMLVCRQTMAEMMQILPLENFIRIHRSFVVSLDKIQKITKHELFVNNVEIPIGVSYEDKLTLIREKLISKK